MDAQMSPKTLALGYTVCSGLFALNNRGKFNTGCYILDMIFYSYKCLILIILMSFH